jgi:hypothetical protein
MILTVNSPGSRLVAVLFAFGIALFCANPAACAQQSAAEAQALLTSAPWKFDLYTRVFKADGTMSCHMKKWGGTWELTDTELVLKVLNGEVWHFGLPLDPKGTQGWEKQGKRGTLVRQKPSGGDNSDTPDEPVEATPSPTPPIPANVQAEASAVIQAHHDGLVFVTGSAGAGSGFIVKMGSGGNFLITNVHVTAEIRDAAFKTLAGDPVSTGAPSLAVGEDIFCMSLPAGGTPFEIMQNVDANVAVGDDVVVLGNAEGGGVINTIIGKIVGIGPDLVEVDAPFVPGNSGSPIIHLKTGKVIGVATYTVTNLYDLTTNKKLAKPVVRRFGYRVDSVKGWQAINWAAFQAQADEMDSVQGLTNDLYDFVQDLSDNNGKITLGRHTNPIIKNRIDAWLEQKGNHASAEDAADADANFINSLKLACQTGIPQAQQQITYDYFRRELKDQIQGRNELANDFQAIIKGIGQ